MRERQRSAQPHLPAVDGRFGTIHPVAGLPFVRTAQAYSESLAATEHIPFRNAEDSSRSHLVVTFGGDVHFQLTVERKVVDRVDLQVERVLAAGGVARGILHFGIPENTQARIAGLGPLLFFLRIKVARPEPQAVIKHRRTDAQFAFVIDGHVFVTYRIGGCLIVIAVQPD